MAHIHTEPGQYDLSVTAIIIRYENNVPMALVHEHKKLGILLPVGGHVELDENPWQAVVREIKEESGYDIRQLKVLQPKERIKNTPTTNEHPAPLFLHSHEYKADPGHFHIGIGFLFIAEDYPVGESDDGEAAELFWLNHEQVKANVDKMPPDAPPIYDFVFTTALTLWEAVNSDEY